MGGLGRRPRGRYAPLTDRRPTRTDAGKAPHFSAAAQEAYGPTLMRHFQKQSRLLADPARRQNTPPDPRALENLAASD